MSANNSRLFYQISSTISGPWMKNGVLDITGFRQRTNEQLWEFIATLHIRRWIYCCLSEFPTCRRCVFFSCHFDRNEWLWRPWSFNMKPACRVSAWTAEWNNCFSSYWHELWGANGHGVEEGEEPDLIFISPSPFQFIHVSIAAVVLGWGRGLQKNTEGMKEKRLFISRCVTIYLLEVSFISSIKCCWWQLVVFYSRQKRKSGVGRNSSSSSSGPCSWLVLLFSPSLRTLIGPIRFRLLLLILKIFYFCYYVLKMPSLAS